MIRINLLPREEVARRRKITLPNVGNFAPLVLLLAALAAVRLGAFSPLALAAFIPAVLQTTAGITRLDRPASLKRVGILLTAHSIVFGLAVICLA